MAQHKKKTARPWLRWLLLLPIPALWCVVEDRGLLDFFESRTLDWRFRARGEIDAPVKLVYADLDTRAVQEIGERPWDRADFGRAAQSILEIGGAKGIGFDLVFSDYGVSKMVSREELEKRNMALGRVVRFHPEIVLGAQYSGGQADTQEGARRDFPLLRKGYTDRNKNDLPERPQYPLIGSFTHPQTGTIETWGTVGLFDVDYEYGGGSTPRWVPLFAHTVGPTFLHLSLQLALVDLGLDQSAVRIHEDTIEIVRGDGSLVTTIPLTENQLLEANWFSPWISEKNPRVSLADVLLHQEALASEDAAERMEADRFFAVFKDAIVLVGPVDPLLQDLAPTPFDEQPMPKVGIHGNLVKTIRAGLFLRRFDQSTTIAIVFALTMVVSGLAATGGARELWFKLGAAAIVAAYVGFAFFAFKSGHLVLPLTAPLGAVFTTSFVAIAWQLVEEQKQKGRIKGMFGAYVSPQLVNRMVESGEDPKLGGHEEEITAYFSDIQSFSSFSEKLPPGKLVELMKEYLTACTDIVQAEGGTLDKYIGDAVVAMFGAPVPLKDHAYRACVASQLVHRRLGELREKWRSEGDKWPEIVWNMQSRIGLNSGLATIGNMGSRTRFNYTMMGDNVNLAARMESGAKSWGTYTMVAEATKLACEQHGGDRVVVRPLGRIKVMGRTQAVPTFEIVGLKEWITPETRECLALFEQALAKYYERDWDGAAVLFERSARLELNQPGKTAGVKDNPSTVYLRIVKRYEAAPPPEEWDGVYEMTEK